MVSVRSFHKHIIDYQDTLRKRLNSSGTSAIPCEIFEKLKPFANLICSELDVVQSADFLSRRRVAKCLFKFFIRLVRLSILMEKSSIDISLMLSASSPLTARSRSSTQSGF